MVIFTANNATGVWVDMELSKNICTCTVGFRVEHDPLGMVGAGGISGHAHIIAIVGPIDCIRVTG